MNAVIAKKSKTINIKLNYIYKNVIKYTYITF